MDKYMFQATFYNLHGDLDEFQDIEVEARTIWGAWTKALHEALKKETEFYQLVELDFIYG